MDLLSDVCCFRETEVKQRLPIGELPVPIQELPVGKHELQEKAPIAEVQCENRELPMGNQELPISVAAASANRRISGRGGSGGSGAGSRVMDGMSPLNILTGYNNNNKFVKICTNK